MKEQLYKVASTATNIDPVDETEIKTGIVTGQAGNSYQQNLFEYYTSEQLYSLSTEFKNLLEAYGVTLSASNNTQILTLLQDAVLPWSATITYKQYSLCQVAGLIYVSLQNANTNHAVTDTSWWTGMDINADTITCNTLSAKDKNYIVSNNSIFVSGNANDSIASIPKLAESLELNYKNKNFLTMDSVNIGTSASSYFPYDLLIAKGFLWCTWREDDKLYKINKDTMDVVSSISVGTYPQGLASSDNEIYICNYSSNNVSVYNILTGLITHTIAVGTNPFKICKVGDNEMWVCNYGSANVSVIDITSKTVTQTISVGTNPSDIIYTGESQNGVGVDNGCVFVANYTSDTISVIDSGYNVLTPIDTASAGNNPSCLAYDTNYLWVGFNNGYINKYQINLKGKALSNSIQTASQLVDLMFNGKHIYSIGYDTAYIDKIDLTLDGAISGCIPDVYDLSTSPTGYTSISGCAFDGEYLYVSGSSIAAPYYARILKINI